MLIRNSLSSSYRLSNHIKLVRSIGTSLNLYTDALSQNRNINIFDRDAKRKQKERAALSPTVEFCDYLKEVAGERLADRIFDLTKEIDKAADIGCGRGFVSKHLRPNDVKHLYLCDSSPTMLKQAEVKEHVNHTKLEMDEEIPNFEENSLDLVVSNLSLHWVNDLLGCFKAIHKSLKPDGVFLGSIFGGDTLYELRSSLQLAEIERKGGISPHVSPFTQIRDLGGLLNRAKYTMLTMDSDEVVIGYPSMFELIYDIKGMGENNAAFNRPLHLSRDVLIAAAAIYNDMYKSDDEKGVHATFQIISFIAWKPGPNQPKPLDPSKADVSFQDLDKLLDGKLNKK